MTFQLFPIVHCPLKHQRRLKEQSEIMTLFMLCILSYLQELRIRFIFNLIFFLGAKFQLHLPEEVFCQQDVSIWLIHFPEEMAYNK